MTDKELLIKTILRWIIRLLSTTAFVCIVFYVGLWVYFLSAKYKISDQIKNELNKSIQGECSIQDLNVSLFHTFPFISLELSQVSIRDSNWAKHRHDLFSAEKVYAEISPLQLIFRSDPIRELIIENATVYLYTDSNGYSNLSVFTKHGSQARQPNADYPAIVCHNFQFIMEKRQRHKIFSFLFDDLKAEIRKRNNTLQFSGDVDMKVQKMVFNPDNGSFLSGRHVAGKCKGTFNLQSKILSVTAGALMIEGHRYKVNGKFFMGLEPTPYLVELSTTAVHYGQVAVLLSPNIQKVLSHYSTEKEFDMTAFIDGANPLFSSPVLTVSMEVEGADIKTPVETFDDCHFKGVFYNRVDGSNPPGDGNSKIGLLGFTGLVEKIPLQSDSIVFLNLIQPELKCNLHSRCLLKYFNDIFGKKLVNFESGIAQINIQYDGPLQQGDSVSALLGGSFTFDSARLNYTSKDVTFTNCSGKLVFAGPDLLIDRFEGTVGSTKLKMVGKVRNLVALVDVKPLKLLFDWNISSARLDFHDLGPFLQQTKESEPGDQSKVFFTKRLSQIDSIMDNAEGHLHLRASEVLFHQFNADAVTASITLGKAGVSLDSANFLTAGGAVDIQGSIRSEKGSQSFSIRAAIRQVSVTKFLKEITLLDKTNLSEKNLRGGLDAEFSVSGALDGQKKLIQEKMNGHIDFHLRGGELMNYESLENTAKKFFKGRDFSDVRFADLQDRIDVHGSELKINRMEIGTNVLTLFLQGIYDTRRGPDLGIEVPISNLKPKKKSRNSKDDQTYGKNGPYVHLRAKKATDGKLTVTWDPLRKAGKLL